MKCLNNSKSEFIICGDMNTDYLNENYWKKLLTSLLTTCNLLHKVHFATQMQSDFDHNW